MGSRLKGCPAALPGLLLAVGVKTFLSPCVHTDGTASACAGAGNALFIAGLALTVLALVRAFLPGKAKAAADAALLLASASVLLINGLMKTCMMASMLCNAVMKPAAWMLGGVCLILYAVLLAFDLRAMKEKHS